jgi:hypothetical protein
MDRDLAEPSPSGTPRQQPAVSQPSSPVADGERAAKGAYVAPSRQNMKRIQGYFSQRVKRQLRMLAAQEDKTEEQLVGEALNLLFQKHQLPTIAFEGKEGDT